MADYIISERTPLLLSLSLSFSLSPSARPLPPQKRTHCYKEQKKKKGCVTACKLHCYLFVSFLSLTPPPPLLSFFPSLSLSLSLSPSPSPAPQVRISHESDRLAWCHCHLPDHTQQLSLSALQTPTQIYQIWPPYILRSPHRCASKKKKRNYFGAAAVGLGTRLYIYLCVCERVRVYECWGGIERERE